MIASLLITQANWAGKTHALVRQQTESVSLDALRDQVCDFAFHALRPDPLGGAGGPIATHAARVQEP
jgi:hypothetical protein